MKTRENELHEPTTKTERLIADGRLWTYFYCPICGKKLCGSCSQNAYKYSEDYFPNYCSNCGARLKEV